MSNNLNYENEYLPVLKETLSIVNYYKWNTWTFLNNELTINGTLEYFASIFNIYICSLHISYNYLSPIEDLNKS